jgi:hypothetical protein
MLAERKFNIVIINNKKGNGAGLAEQYDKSVSYSGKRIIIKL